MHWRKEYLIYFLTLLISCSNKKSKGVEHLNFDVTQLNYFVYLTQSNDVVSSQSLLDSILKKALHDSLIFRKCTEYLTKPFSNPNSPYRSEALYDRILRAQYYSIWYSDQEKSKILARLHLLHQNDVGMAANNFEFIMPNSGRKSLYSLMAEYTLIYFYNPECEACQEFKSSLIKSSKIRQIVESKRLIVLCIYVGDNLKLWRAHLKEFPKRWLHGRDENENLFRNNLYNLNAIPAVYFLNRDKKVILKDCISINKIEEYF